MKIQTHKKSKEQLNRELIIEVLKGEAHTCRHCGSHDLKETPRGYPIDSETKGNELTLTELRCNKCSTVYQVVFESAKQHKHL